MRCLRSGPSSLAYVLSFVYLGIYWINHHHLLHATQHDQRLPCCGPTFTCCSGCRSCPPGTAWIGQTGFAPIPVAVYGFMLLMPAIAFSILV